MKKIYFAAILCLVGLSTFAYDFSFEPKSNPWVGVTVGYVSSQSVTFDGSKTTTTGMLGETKLTSEEKEYIKEVQKEGGSIYYPDRNYSTGLQLGVTLNPEFKYGIGLKTGLLYECAIYSKSVSYNMSGTSFCEYSTLSNHALSIPIQASWRVDIYKDLSAFIYTGIVIDAYLGTYSEMGGYSKEAGYTQENYSYIKGQNSYSSKIYYRSVSKSNDETVKYPKSGWAEEDNEPYMSRCNVLWAVGAGVQWKGLRLTIGGQFGMNNLVNNKDLKDYGYRVNINKPFEISLSYLFLDYKK